MAKSVKKPKEAADLFEKIMQASVKEEPKKKSPSQKKKKIKK
jgi:hypothetical protein